MPRVENELAGVLEEVSAVWVKLWAEEKQTPSPPKRTRDDHCLFTSVIVCQNVSAELF